jgi:hypothetical protein
LLPIPSKWSIKIGEPIHLPPGVGSKEETLELAEMVRSKLDRTIAELLSARRSVLFG